MPSQYLTSALDNLTDTRIDHAINYPIEEENHEMTREELEVLDSSPESP